MASTNRQDGVKVTVIAAIAGIITSLITAGATIYQTSATAKQAANEAAAAASDARQSVEKIDRLKQADAALTETRCPTALTRQGLPLVKPFWDHFESASGSDRTLLNIQGKGCLMSGFVLGYYFKSSAGGTNYTISIAIDGYEFAYPTGPSDVPVAYAQNVAGENTGVLVLPQIAFRESLRISYYPGEGKEINGYALATYE